jgi:hypothetical protein
MVYLTPQELASLPVGTIVRYDGDEGEIIQAGREVQIIWTNVTSIIDTKQKAWETLISEMTAEE